MRRLEDHYWWFVGRREAVVALLAERLTPGQHRIIGDIGCGTGATSLALRALGQVIAVDLSPEALTLHSQREDHGPMVQASATGLPFAPGVFDVMTYLDMLEHVEADDIALAEAYRLLAPGGLLLVSVPAHPWLWGSHDISLHHMRRYRRTELISKLLDAGFELERCTFAVSLLAPLAVVYRLAGHLFGRSRPAHSEAMELPAAINKLLIWIMRLERALLLRWNLPAGISLLCLAHKPELSDTPT